MSVEGYLRQAAHNRQVAVRLSTEAPISLQWATTCVFYAGVHYVNALLYHVDRQTPATHGDREQLMSDRMRSIYRAYKRLKADSEYARYMLGQPTGAAYRNSCECADEIQEFVNRQLGV